MSNQDDLIVRNHNQTPEAVAEFWASKGKVSIAKPVPMPKVIASPSPLDIMLKAFTDAGYTFRVFIDNEPSEYRPDDVYKYIILTGGSDEEYEGLTCKEAVNKSKYFFEFCNGEIASY